MRHESNLTCLHAAEGLCPACQEEYAEDSAAWIEFGQHKQGVENWRRELELIAADERERDAEGQAEVDWSGIPI